MVDNLRRSLVEDREGAQRGDFIPRLSSVPLNGALLCNWPQRGDRHAYRALRRN